MLSGMLRGGVNLLPGYWNIPRRATITLVSQRESAGNVHELDYLGCLSPLVWSDRATHQECQDRQAQSDVEAFDPSFFCQ